MTTSTFEELNLQDSICSNLKAEGYQTPTPIQRESIPVVLEGRDIIGCAQTGTGKTAAFALPIIQYLLTNKKKVAQRGSRVLILSPTRELAIQISENIETYSKNMPIRFATIFGGVPEGKQIRAVRNGIEIIIATPGRLLDLVNRGEIDLSRIEVFVLDEADRMLDMGFMKDVKKIIKMIPAKRQTLLFSATMPTEIDKLAKSILQKPVSISVNPISSTAEKVVEKIMFVNKKDKYPLLLDILNDKKIKRVLIFTRTKRGANKLSERLESSKIHSAAIHGNKSQGARQRALESFKNSSIRVLVATDIFARGIDVDDITHVVNFELPNDPESYVHRIGRTARAGNSGIAISFCDHEERTYLKDIEKVIGRKIDQDITHSYHEEHSGPPPKKSSPAKRPSRSRNKRPNFKRKKVA